MRPIYVHGWLGMGDTIYFRPGVKAWAAERPVHVHTAWPELFDDLDVGFVRPDTNLRTQAKNIARQPRGTWSPPPTRAERIKPHQSRAYGSIPQAIVRSMKMGARPYAMGLPDFGPPPVSTHKPVALLRPVTLRAEWMNWARAPDPDYLRSAARILTEHGYYVVSVADVDGDQEWYEGTPPVTDAVFHAGELDVRELMALTRHATVVVGGVGWIVPACLAYGTPAIIVGGGNGAYNNPAWLAGPLTDDRRFTWILPDNYCMCSDPVHRCPKHISDFDARFTEALEALSCPA